MKLKISLFYLFFYLGMGIYQPFLSLFLQQRGFNGSEIGILLAASSLTGIAAQPIFGLISDGSKDYRTLLKILLFLSAVLVLGFFYSHGFLSMILILIAFSFINSPTAPILDSIAVESGQAYGFTYGQVRLWGALGYALITFIAGYTFSIIGFQYSFPAYAVIAIIMVFLIFSFPKLENERRTEAIGRNSVIHLFSNWQFDYFLFVGLIIMAVVTMNFSYLSIYFQKLHYPIDLVGWNFTIAAAVEIPLFWLSSKVIRRLGLFPALAAGVAAYTLKYLLMSFAPPVGVVLGAQVLDGFAFAFYMSSVVEIVNLMAPQSAKATAQTVFAAAGGVAGIIGNIAGGWTIDHMGPQFLFRLMGGIGLLAVLLIFLFPDKHHYHLESEVKPESILK